MPTGNSSSGRAGLSRPPQEYDADTVVSSRRAAVLVALVVGTVALLLSEATISGSDGQTMYAVAKSIAAGHGPSVDPALGVPGRDAAYFSRYGLGLSLLALPVEAAGRALGVREFLREAAVASLMPVVAGGLAAVALLLGLALGGSLASSAAVGLATVAGTFVLPYAKDFFSEPLAALFVVLTLERALRGSAGQAGLAAGLAGVTRPQLFVLAPVLAAYVYARYGFRRAVSAGFALLPGLVIVLAYNRARFGSPFVLGYEDVAFSTPFLEGAVGLLFHPDKSLLLFAPLAMLVPPALLDVWRRRRIDALLLLAPFLITFVMTATWFAWPGGWCWGPRLLIPGLVPVLVALAPWAATRSRRRAVMALAFLGFLVSAPALVVNTRAQQLDVPPPSTGPGVLRQYALVRPVAAYSLDHLFERGDGQHLQYLSLWQVGAARLYGPAGLALALAISVLLAAAGIASAARLRAALNPP